MRVFSQEIPQSLTTKISLKITHLNFTLNLPGANELNLTSSIVSYRAYYSSPVIYSGTPWAKPGTTKPGNFLLEAQFTVAYRQAAGQTAKHGDFFYSGDLWPEGLLASLTYINGPSGDRQIWKVLQRKSDKYFKMNIRTIQLNDPIECKILFYICGPDFEAISTIFMWDFRRKQSSVEWTFYSLSRWCTKIWFCNLMLLPYRLLLQNKFLTL